MDTFRGNTGRFSRRRNHSETIAAGSHTGSFFGIQVLNDGCLIGSINPVGKPVITNMDLTTGSSYPFEFTAFRIESGSAIIYEQSTD